MLFQFVAECRGSQVDSDNRSWIEDSRSLPDEDLSYIAARFCEDDPVLIQVSYSKQECIPVGCVPSAAVAMPIPACTGQGEVYPSIHWAGVCVSQHALGRGCLPRGCLPRGGVCPGVVSAQGMWGCLSTQGCVSQHALRQTPPCEQND